MKEDITLTPNIGLIKMGGSLVASPKQMNENMDNLDKELGNIKKHIGDDGEVISNLKTAVQHITNVWIEKDSWKLKDGIYVQSYKNELITKDTVVDVYFVNESRISARNVFGTRTIKDKEIEILADSKPLANLNCNLLLLTEVK